MVYREWSKQRLGGDAYSGGLLPDTSRATGDEDDLASHVWHVLSFELGATRKDVLVDDGPQTSHVG